MTRELEDIKRAIARVDARDDAMSKTGTAFYVGGVYAVTALHVVAEARIRSPRFLSSITLEFYRAKTPVPAAVVDGLWSVEGDWAVLRIEEAPSAAPIELGGEPTPDSEWRTFGFPEIQTEGMHMKGEVRDPDLLPMAAAGELPAHPVLQLFGEEAAAGMGAPMHGFSGAPCLVDGKAVGILRSTLIEEVHDGQLRRLLFTQAGTLYATPARSLVDWQGDRHTATLSGTWAPPSVVTQDFIVLLSDREPRDGQPTDRAAISLRNVAKEAFDRLPKSGLSAPYFLWASDALSAEPELEACVRALCNAKVVVLDATGFEPAIMFLAGIRAVVRRGVTLLSVGAPYALGSELDIPFNVTDANIVAHSRAQNRLPTNSVSLLTQRIARGLEAMRSAQYLDLPVYDAVRRLPADRRGIIPSVEGVLVLCPFDDHYATFWAESLSQALTGELDKLRAGEGVTDPTPFGVSRSFELNSPRLVTQAVYEAIRRVQSCVIDLTTWSPSVLFEFGARLAASGHRTACILDRHWADTIPESLAPQCRKIEALFVADDFKYDASRGWEGQPAFRNAYGPTASRLKSALLEGGLHALVERALDLEGDPASRQVFQELLDQAAMFARDASGGRTKPVGLFPGNAELVQREEIAEFERLLAAWLYISNRYQPDEILQTASIREATDTVIQTLFERHDSRLVPATSTALSAMWDRIDDWKRKHGRPTTG